MTRPATADLRLRGSAPIRVTWPAATPVAPLPLVVYVGHEPRIDSPAVVLAADAFEDALRALEWCADHGAELGGDPRRLIVAGERTVVSTQGGDPLTIMQSYFAISRNIAAPRERVFQAWTEPELVRRWYRGDPFVCGEVDPPARIVFTAGGSDLAIVTLSVVDDHTVMTFESGAPEADVDDVEQEWAGMLDALIATVAQGSHSGGNAAGIRPG